MPTSELTAADVEAYAQGRLSADDPETQRLLDAATAALRKYCGWRVTPVASETITVDGSGWSSLILPTQKIVSLTSITADGTAVHLTEVQQSSAAAGVLYLSGCKTWNKGYGNISVTLEHGWDDAHDFQAAILEMVDRMAAQVGSVRGNSGPPAERRVDDVSERWAPTIGHAPELFSLINHTLVDRYQLVQFV
jgi:hypothetical protein